VVLVAKVRAAVAPGPHDLRPFAVRRGFRHAGPNASIQGRTAPTRATGRTTLPHIAACSDPGDSRLSRQKRPIAPARCEEIDTKSLMADH
jgi:hypothetical protein